MTRDNVGKRMAIILFEKGKGEVVTAPVIRQEIAGGRVQISGRMRRLKRRIPHCFCVPVLWLLRWKSSKND